MGYLVQAIWCAIVVIFYVIWPFLILAGVMFLISILVRSTKANKKK